MVGCRRDGILRRYAPQNDMNFMTLSVGEGLAPPVRGNVDSVKMYGDFVKCYDFAVHSFSID